MTSVLMENLAGFDRSHLDIPPFPHLWLSPGMDTQLYVRPLLEKVEKNTQESAQRAIIFPHVSIETVSVFQSNYTMFFFFEVNGKLLIWDSKIAR